MAKLAGVPDSVIERAKELVDELSVADITDRMKEIGAGSMGTAHRPSDKKTASEADGSGWLFDGGADGVSYPGSIHESPAPYPAGQSNGESALTQLAREVLDTLKNADLPVCALWRP